MKSSSLWICLFYLIDCYSIVLSYADVKLRYGIDKGRLLISLLEITLVPHAMFRMKRKKHVLRPYGWIHSSLISMILRLSPF